MTPGPDSALHASPARLSRNEFLRELCLRRTSDLRPASPCWSLTQTQSASQNKTTSFEVALFWLTVIEEVIAIIKSDSPTYY